MKKLVITFTLLFYFITNYSQNHLSITELANITFNEESSDIWGYVDDYGIEYAIIANFSEVKIYSLETPSSPDLIETISVDGSSWHDIKSYGSYIYHASESSEDGITVIDMSNINNITHDVFEPFIDDLLLTSIHNIFVDEFGILYACGTNVERGVLFFDLNSDPEDPDLVGRQHDVYTHDIYVQNNIMYSSQVFNGELHIFDVSNKSNPQKIGETNTGNSFTHNAWASTDGNYVFTTDERPNSYVEAYDISDFSDIQFLDRANSGSDDNTIIPHNTHFHDNYLVTSWYTEGVVVLDATRPDILVKVGQYDTYQGSNTGFDGCWGVYPFLPSGLIIASDISEGLFVLQPSYQHASYLEGTITDAITGLVINNATISIDNTDIEDFSNAAGKYKTGFNTDGSHIVRVSAADYIEQSFKINFTAGQTIQLDVALYDVIFGNQDNDGDGFTILSDCDDNNPNIFPGNMEIIYNGIDDDCDPSTFDDDIDQDGFASANDCDDFNPTISPANPELPYNGIDDDCNASTLDNDLDQDGFNLAEDCDDNNSGIFPGQTELPYNDVDDDCDPLTPDDDIDQDGFNMEQDCNDNNPGVYPGAIEIIYNGIDDDCDPSTLDDDIDQDGFASANDCDDFNPAIAPGLTEVPYNGIDDDCNTNTPDDDIDQDGFNLADDCDDNNSGIFPGQIEVPYNGIDDDCNPASLDDDLDQDGFGQGEDCNENDSSISPAATEIENNDIDEDCDGIILMIDNDNDGFNSDEDCDDENASINPGVMEIPNNDIDEDCNGEALIIDNDNDGFNSDEDCDDENENINPDAIEITNNDIDEDCDGEVLVIDNDNDGFNSDEDCDDEDANINPDAEEIVNNGIDEDCDGADLISNTIELIGFKMEVYPNPFKDQINVQISEVGNYQLKLLTTTGILVESKTINRETTINLNELPAGLYVIQTENLENGEKVSQLVVKE